MKHFLFSMILVLCAAVAHGAPTMQGPNYVTNGTRTITWTFDTTTAATPLFGVVGTCAAKVDIAGSDVLTLYQTNAATATSGTSVTTFSADTTAPTSLAIGQKNIYATSTGATGGSTMTIECTPAIVSSLNTLFQNTPSTTVEADKLTASVKSPADVKFGWGVATEATPPPFTAKTYPGGSTDGSELNHMMGWYYNKSGIYQSVIPNMFEHAYDFSIETAYRSTSGTGDSTLVEWNWDFYPPDIISQLSGSSTGTWAAGDTLTFSGGGTGYLVSLSGSDPTKTIIWRQDFGTTAAGETVSNVTHATSAATLGTLTADPDRLTWRGNGGSAKSLRAFLLTYNTKINTASFDFWTGYDSPTSQATMSIGAGLVRVNGRQVMGIVASGTSTLGGSSISAGACATLVTTAASGTATTDTIRWSYASAPTTATKLLIVNAYTTANNVNFSVCNPGAGSVVPAAVDVNWVVER